MPSAQLLRFGLEDRCRERGPWFGGDGEIRTHTVLFTRQSLCQLELHRLTEWGTGREAGAPLRTPRSRDSLRSARMSHAPIACEIKLVPKEGLKPSTSGL